MIVFVNLSGIDHSASRLLEVVVRLLRTDNSRMWIGCSVETLLGPKLYPKAKVTSLDGRCKMNSILCIQASNAAGSDTSRLRLEVCADEAPTGEDPPTFLRRLQDLTVKVGTRTRFLVEIVSSTECKVSRAQQKLDKHRRQIILQ